LIAAEKRLLTPVTEAEKVYKAGIAAYTAEQRRLEAEAQRLAEAEALRRAEAQRELELERAEAQGADIEEIRAMVNEPLLVVPPRIEPAFQQAKGVTTATNWKAQVVSLELLVKAIAGGKANINLVRPNEVAINALARATHGSLVIPGVQFFTESVVRAGRR
jgi:hypothetical protein